jgi:hypothetical protein
MAIKKSDIYRSLWESCDQLRGGMDASLMARMKELEQENQRLRKMYVEEKLKAEIISEALAKKW